MGRAVTVVYCARCGGSAPPSGTVTSGRRRLLPNPKETSGGSAQRGCHSSDRQPADPERWMCDGGGGWRGAAPRDSPMRDGTERASSAVKDSVVDAPLTEVGALARCWTLTDTFAVTHTVRGAMPNAGALCPPSSALLRRALLLWSGHPTARRVRRARPPTAPQRRTRAPLHVRMLLGICASLQCWGALRPPSTVLSPAR